jgi:hypothetical protein
MEKDRTVNLNTCLEVLSACVVGPQTVLHWRYCTPVESPAVGAGLIPFWHAGSQLGRPMSSAGCPASKSGFQWR